jgi:Domain of unknown function DUF11
MKQYGTVGAGLVLSAALAACGGGGGGTPPPPASSDVSVSATALSGAANATKFGAVTSAGTLGYTVTVSNAGPDKAASTTLEGDVSATHTLEAKACTASGGAVCPSTISGTNQVLADLPVGGKLEFVYHAAAPITTTGNVQANFKVLGTGDPIATNNAGVVQTTLDARNARYTAFGFDGVMSSLDVNFNSGLYGFGTTALTYGFLDTKADGTIVTSLAAGSSATEGLRYKDDVIVGSLNIAGARKSFVAARKFVTNPTELSGNMNILGISIGSVVDSSIFTGRWLNSGTTLQLCVDNIITTTANCPNAATSVRNYALTFNGADITAFDSVNNDTSLIRVAKMGSAQIYLRAGIQGTGTDRRFRIGFSEGSSTFNTQTYAWGASNNFPLTSTLSDTLYTSASVGTDPYTVNVPIGPSGTAAPSVRGGKNTTSTPATIKDGNLFVIQGPLVAAVGAKNSPFTGRVEVSIP